MRLKGKTAIVTGGASGFGAGIVRYFVEEGAQVVIADMNLDAAGSIADELGANAFAVEVDVSQDGSVAAMVEAAHTHVGEVNILVNNAGIGHPPQPLEDLSPTVFDHLFAVNAKSVYLTARHIVPIMKSQGGGVILNIASTGGVSPRPNLTWYNASKGWMIAATLGFHDRHYVAGREVH